MRVPVLTFSHRPIVEKGFLAPCCARRRSSPRGRSIFLPCEGGPSYSRDDPRRRWRDRTPAESAWMNDACSSGGELDHARVFVRPPQRREDFIAHTEVRVTHVRVFRRLGKSEREFAEVVGGHDFEPWDWKDALANTILLASDCLTKPDARINPWTIQRSTLRSKSHARRLSSGTSWS